MVAANQLPQFKFGLLENAIDSINHGFDHLKIAIDENDSSDYKQTILLIFQGVELLLKELLFQKNPIYIFDKNVLFEKCSDFNNPALEELYNCKSLDINQISNSIKKLHPDLFDRSAFQIIRDSAKIRNMIQHFAIEIKKEEIIKTIVKLYGKVITPALQHIGKTHIDGCLKNVFESRIDDILHFNKIAEQQAEILKISDFDFEKGNCFACGNYSLFFIYSNGPEFAESFYCTSCGYSKKSLCDLEKFTCPECNAISLIYCEELKDGVCLWYNCGNNKDGGILTPMEWCHKCKNYKIESVCECSSDVDIEDNSKTLSQVLRKLP